SADDGGSADDRWAAVAAGIRRGSPRERRARPGLGLLCRCRYRSARRASHLGQQPQNERLCNQIGDLETRTRADERAREPQSDEQEQCAETSCTTDAEALSRMEI